MGVRVRCRHCDVVMSRCRCMQKHVVTYETCPACEGLDNAPGRPMVVAPEPQWRPSDKDQGHDPSAAE